MEQVLLLLLAAVLVIACGAFVAAEFSFLTVDRASVERAAEAGNRRAGGTLTALRTLSTQLSGAQVGITITNLAIGYLAEPAIGDLLHPPLERAGLSAGAATAASVTAALVLSTLGTMVFGELVPKNLAIARPLATANAVQGLSRGFARAMSLPIKVLNGTANTILRRLFRVEPQEELASARSADELLSLVRRSEEQGTLEADTAALVRRSLGFADRRAADVMTPRVQVATLHGADHLDDLVAAVHATGRSRFPVVGDTQDDVLGVVHARQALQVPATQAGLVPLADVVQPALLVPETVELDALLDRLKDSALQLAVVVDEYGGFAGVVTLEDLIEEIVGEVIDEHDVHTRPIRPAGLGQWLLSGLVRPDEVLDRTGIALPEDNAYETVAGLIAQRLGRVPALGDVVEVDAVVRAEHLDAAAGSDEADDDLAPLPVHAPVRLRVEGMDGLRVAQVRLSTPDRARSGGPPPRAAGLAPGPPPRAPHEGPTP